MVKNKVIFIFLTFMSTACSAMDVDSPIVVSALNDNGYCENNSSVFDYQKYLAMYNSTDYAQMEDPVHDWLCSNNNSSNNAETVTPTNVSPFGYYSSSDSEADNSSMNVSSSESGLSNDSDSVYDSSNDSDASDTCSHNAYPSSNNNEPLLCIVPAIRRVTKKRKISAVKYPKQCNWGGSCNQWFKTSREFWEHLDDNHTKSIKKDENGKYICDLCLHPNSWSGKTKYQLLLHLRSKKHANFPKYLCKFSMQNGKNCQRRFFNNNNRDGHINSFHLEIKPYKCPVTECTWSCANQSNLRNHISQNHPEKDPNNKKRRGKRKSLNSTKKTSKRRKRKTRTLSNNSSPNNTQSRTLLQIPVVISAISNLGNKQKTGSAKFSLKCPHCPKNNSTKYFRKISINACDTYLHKHINEFHKGKASYACYFCSQIYMTSEERIQHTNEQHTKRKSLK